MPPISSQDLLSSFQENLKSQKGPGDFLAQGVQFAGNMAGLKLKQQELESRKQKMDITKAEHQISVGDSILKNMEKLSNVTDPKARRLIGEQIAQAAALSGKPMDDASIAEIIGDVEKQKALITRIQSLLDKATPHQQRVLKASLPEVLPTLTPSQLLAKAEELEKIILVAPEKEKQAKIEERKVDIAEKGVELKEEEIDLSKDKLEESKRQFDEGIILKKEQLTQKMKLAKTEAEKKKLESAGSEFDNISKSKSFDDYRVVRTAAREVDAALDADSPFGSLKTLFSFIKTLDPGSVVRESEAGAFKGTGSLGTKMASYLNDLRFGNALKAEAIKEDIRLQVRDSLQNKMEGYGRFISSKKKNLEARGLKDFDPASKFYNTDLKFLNKLGGIKKTKGENSAVEKRAQSQDVALVKKPQLNALMTKVQKLQDKVASGRATPREREVLSQAMDFISKKRRELEGSK